MSIRVDPSATRGERTILCSYVSSLLRNDQQGDSFPPFDDSTFRGQFNDAGLKLIPNDGTAEMGLADLYESVQGRGERCDGCGRVLAFGARHGVVLCCGGYSVNVSQGEKRLVNRW